VLRVLGLCEEFQRFSAGRGTQILSGEILIALQLPYFQTFKRSDGTHDVMAGVSGGKDSSAMLYLLKEQGMKQMCEILRLNSYH
jgi:hypothetical protein